MGKLRKTQKFAKVKRMLKPKDQRIPNNPRIKKTKKTKESLRRISKTSSSMFLQYNTSLGPPYQVILDTNFINFSIQNKLDIVQSFYDLLLAKAIPCVTDCVIGELEKLGSKFRVALRVSKDPRFKRIHCGCNGYADDCICNLVTQHKCYMVATSDKDLKRRIRKIPGVPIVGIKNHKYTVERLPI
ncbi:rRNA-processing protein fcf1 [Anaeramoeba ignava]|uniref:rRNA-processing protein fcf1 n=1 Tax=Anaeramoeba ignava TaxID=1746090 RepID=A0A9Q0LM86_ANAIG|nr:rRNA-processing protein fcf1 [Anaeramoeba ignava]|eukprot:Anaeramoba_ignava/a16235_10.p1 GENE.a16235_10~~a16235_10.p1  ORF type:complete len:186 (+),score=23.18 a16235_10:23-580(+)